MRHVALLRAVNVGGRVLPMSDARGLCEDLGFTSVSSLLQSGNLVFDSGRLTGARLEAALEAEALARWKADTRFFVRTPAQWEAALAANPFTKEAKSDPARLVILTLKNAVKPVALEDLRASIVGRERVHAEGNHLYAHYPDGSGRSKLTLAAIEKRLGTRATARNWNTALKIQTLLNARP